MKITFDANVLRKVVAPEQFINDPEHTSYKKIHEAIKTKNIQPFMSATIFSLETIPKFGRAEFMATNKGKTEFTESLSSGRQQNSIHVRVEFSPDHSLHPGIGPIAAEYFKLAIALGFQIIHVPRIGSPYPDDIRYDLYPERYFSPPDIGAAQERTFAALRKIEARNAGYAHVKKLLARIEKRVGRPVIARQLLTDDNVFNPDERKELAAAVAEWSDGDSVAAHIGNGLDGFCTNDKAGKERPSIFNTKNRKWLNEIYGLIFFSPNSLADYIK